jgi:hypothetical protein
MLSSSDGAENVNSGMTKICLDWADGALPMRKCHPLPRAEVLRSAKGAGVRVTALRECARLSR